MIGGAIRAIIDLLMLRKTEQKATLEISKLRDEQARRDSSIQIASLADVRRYDPRVAELERRLARVEEHHDGVHMAYMSTRPLHLRLRWLRWAIPLLLLLAATTAIYLALLDS